MAQDKAACPLDFKQQTDSIRAFEPIASFLTREPRCANCHGGVNPFIDGTGPDPEDENVPASTTAHGGGRIQRQRDRAPDGTLLIENECMDCHNNLVPRRDGSKSVWMTAPGFLSFIGKDAPTLCRQIKRSTQTAEHFLGHLEDDNGGNNFGGTAFKGDRGLDPDVYDTPPAPPSISHAALMGLGHDWINAMGGALQGDESCGCELTLQGEFAQDGATAATGAAYGVGMNASYRITGRVLWAPKQDSPHDRYVRRRVIDDLGAQGRGNRGAGGVHREKHRGQLQGRGVQNIRDQGSSARRTAIPHSRDRRGRALSPDARDDQHVSPISGHPELLDPRGAWVSDARSGRGQAGCCRE
jgi:hypothetical protein